MINRRDGAADYLNPYSSMRLSRSGRKNIKDQFGQYTRTHSASEFEKLITQNIFYFVMNCISVAPEGLG